MISWCESSYSGGYTANHKQITVKLKYFLQLKSSFNKNINAAANARSWCQFPKIKERAFRVSGGDHSLKVHHR